MHDPPPVDRRERGGEARPDLEGLPDREPPGGGTAPIALPPMSSMTMVQRSRTGSNASTAAPPSPSRSCPTSYSRRNRAISSAPRRSAAGL